MKFPKYIYIYRHIEKKKHKIHKEPHSDSWACRFGHVDSDISSSKEMAELRGIRRGNGRAEREKPKWSLRGRESVLDEGGDGRRWR